MRPNFPQERWPEIDRVFAEVLELPEAERDAYVARACAGDEELATHVRALLCAERGSRHLDAAVVSSVLQEMTSKARGGDAAALPERIGRYRVVEEIGRGGWGTVYRAERDAGDFEHRAAIKVLRRGLDTDDVLARFRAERQILASLAHPGIARLLDGGATEDGQPYLVMELVEGVPITEHCGARRLDVAARLRLFGAVGRAVQYAHRNLVVHRDLKPGNILVTDEGEVKLLDFGIAKLLDPAVGADGAPRTRTGVRPMTPEYASPEQVLGEPVTTASDVYQLGALLYELLSGSRPFESATGSGRRLEDVITREEPPPPSAALLRAVQAGAVPGPEVRRRARALRGDLDTIALKALRREPDRRYASVAELMDDVQRYLEGRPVRARPDSWSYRTRKLLRRRPGIVAAASVALVALVAYGATVTRYAERLAAERDLAKQAAEQAEGVTAFVVRLFEGNHPDESGGETLTAYDLLERGETHVAELEGQPAVQARLLDVVGRMYTMLGEYGRAEEVLRRGVDLARASARSPDAELAGPIVHLGYVLYHRGRYAEAESLLLKGIRLAALAGDAGQEADGYNDLGLTLHAKGDFGGAEAAHRRALLLREREPSLRAFVGASLNNVGLALEHQRRLDEAETYYRESLRLREALWGRDHSETLVVLGNLARLYTEQGRHAEAESSLREVVERSRRRLSPEHPRVALALHDLGSALTRQQRLAEAEAVIRESLAIRERTLGPDHSDVLTSLNNLAFVLVEQGSLEEGTRIRRRVAERARAQFGPDHLNTGVFVNNLAHSLALLDRREEAARQYREAIAILERAAPGAHPLVARPMASLGSLLAEMGRPREGEPLLRAALALRRERDPDPAGEALIESQLGAALAALGQAEEAAALLRSGYERLGLAYAADHREVVRARGRLEAFHLARGDSATARRYRDSAFD